MLKSIRKTVMHYSLYRKYQRTSTVSPLYLHWTQEKMVVDIQCLPSGFYGWGVLAALRKRVRNLEDKEIDAWDGAVHAKCTIVSKCLLLEQSNCQDSVEWHLVSQLANLKKCWVYVLYYLRRTIKNQEIRIWSREISLPYSALVKTETALLAFPLDPRLNRDSTDDAGIHCPEIEFPVTVVDGQQTNSSVMTSTGAVTPSLSTIRAEMLGIMKFSASLKQPMQATMTPKSSCGDAAHQLSSYVRPKKPRH